MISLLLTYLEGDPGQAPAPQLAPAVPPRSPAVAPPPPLSSVDAFNALLAAAFEAEEEAGDLGAAARLLDEARRFADAALILPEPPSLPQAALSPLAATAEVGADTAGQCPHCGRRVVSIAQHSRTCRAAAVAATAAEPATEAIASGDAHVLGVAALASSMHEVVASAQARVEARLLSRLQQLAAAGRLDEARRLWCAGAASLPPQAVARCDAAISTIMSAHFCGFAETVTRELADARRAAAAGPCERGHAYVRAHLALLAEATGVELPRRELLSHPAAPSSEPTTAPLSAVPQPHAEALGQLLGEASTWMAMVLDTGDGVPHASRCRVAAALHDSCVAAALPVIASFRDDTLLAHTACVARALLDLAEGRQGGGVGRRGGRAQLEAWEDVVFAAAGLTPNLLRRGNRADENSEHSGSAADEAAASVAEVTDGDRSETRDGSGLSVTLSPAAVAAAGEPVLVVSFDATFPPQPLRKGGRAQQAAQAAALAAAESDLVFINPQLVAAAAPAPPAVLVPLALPLSGAAAVVDEACNTLSFTCSVLERYLRCATVCLGLGSGDQPSRTTDALAAAAHELQGSYVLLERAYLTTAVARAVRGSVTEASGGWVAVGMGDDPLHVLSFAWADHAFFVLSKAVARACASCCDMAAAAVINFVASSIDDELRRVAASCVALCAILRRNPGAAGQERDVDRLDLAALALPAAGAKAGVGIGDNQERDERDEIESEVARQLAAALGEHVEQGGAVRPGPRGMLLEDNDAALVAAVVAAREPRVADAALVALNTLATVATYAHSLHRRTQAEVEATFPPPRDQLLVLATRGVTSAASSARCHTYLAAPLDTLRAAALGLAKLADDAAARLAATLCAPGLESMRALLAAAPTAAGDDVLLADGACYSYVLSAQDFCRATASSGGAGASMSGASSVGGRDCGSGDALMQAFARGVVEDCGLPAALARLRKEVGGTDGGDGGDGGGSDLCAADSVVLHVSRLVSALLETGWAAAAVSDYGALLQQQQLRECTARLARLARMPHACVTRPFARAMQVVAVLGLDALPDLYELTFGGEPLLTRAEIERLLRLRVGLVRGERAVSALDWNRVKTARSL